jgi:hypothetical protein
MSLGGVAGPHGLSTTFTQLSVKVRTADRGGGDSKDDIGWLLDLRIGHFLDGHLFGHGKYDSFHGGLLPCWGKASPAAFLCNPLLQTSGWNGLPARFRGQPAPGVRLQIMRCIIRGSSRGRGVLCSGALLGGLVACSTQTSAGGAKKSVVHPIACSVLGASHLFLAQISLS